MSAVTDAAVVEVQADAAPSAEGGTGDGAPDAPICTLGTLALVENADQHYGIAVEHAGHVAALLVDTGSPDSYLWLAVPDGGTSGDGGDGMIAAADASCAQEPGCVPDVGAVTIGCETLALDGFLQQSDPPFGSRTAVGTYGDDRLLSRPTWLDLAGHTLQTHAPGDPFAQAASWPATRFSRPYGYVRVEDVELDGKAVPLLLDTGSPSLLWLGQEGGPGDTEVTIEDVNGDATPAYMGQVTVSIGAWSETVQILKVPSFPYFQPLATAAGVQGVLGVPAFSKGVVFDTDGGKVRVAP